MVMWLVLCWDFYCILIEGIYFCLVLMLFGLVVYGMVGLYVVYCVLC